MHSDLPPEVTERLGFLLKHAHQQFEGLSSSALAALDLTPRALGVLRLLAHHEPASQQVVADLLGVDRTTMVTLLDALERQRLVHRRPAAADRRRNVVTLTSAGSQALDRAEAVITAVEDSFFSSVAAADTAVFLQVLRQVVPADADRGRGTGLR
jgi:DNA-binding MarR family transcriptional regulator